MMNLKIARIKSGLTQSELAEKVGVSEVSISKYEQGKAKPQMDTIIKMSQELGVSTDFLLGLED